MEEWNRSGKEEGRGCDLKYRKGRCGMCVRIDIAVSVRTCTCEAFNGWDKLRLFCFEPVVLQSSGNKLMCKKELYGLGTRRLVSHP